MQLLNISELKPHPKNNYFFDDIIGDSWKEFLESIRTSGVIEPVIITQNKVIVSGHQRVRACQELGIKEVMTETRHYNNEDSIIKDLIETNIRQRGIGNPNPVKFGRCIIELERIYGVRAGSANEKGNNRIGESNNFTDQMTEADLANMLGLTRQTLQNYKTLASLIPEVEDFIDTGMISPTTALAITRQLCQEDQAELMKQLDKETKYSKNQIQKYIDQINKLKENPVVPDDYEEIKTNLAKLEKEKERLERKIKLSEEDAEKYKKLKSDIEFLTKQKEDVYRQIESATELSSLTVDMQKMLEVDLAPIKFKRCMDRLDSEVNLNNIKEIINRIDDWSYEMKQIIGMQSEYVLEERY